MITILIIFLSVVIALLIGALVKTSNNNKVLKSEVEGASEKIRILEAKIKNTSSLLDTLVASDNEMKAIHAEHYESASDKVYKDEAAKYNAIKTKLALKIGNELIRVFGAPDKEANGRYVYFFKVKRV